MRGLRMNDDLFSFAPFNGRAPFVAGCDTSEAASDSVTSVMSVMRSRVLAQVKAADATCDEIEVILGMCHQTASARIRELVLSGFVRDTGRRRPTRRNRNARIYTAIRQGNDGRAATAIAHDPSS